MVIVCLWFVCGVRWLCVPLFVCIVCVFLVCVCVCMCFGHV